MIISNEPGYYKEGAFGIRIENLVMVRDAEIDGAEGAFLEFENLTWAPLEPALIDVDHLNAAQRAWVDHYHAAVWDKVSQLLDDAEDKAWLQKICAPLG
jgi:Xaa-Pro aminopeptidase